MTRVRTGQQCATGSDDGSPIELSQVLINGNEGGGEQIKNIADPTDDQDAATKKYVDDEIAANAGASAASDVSFTPAGNISASNVQAAIQELDTEKANVAGVVGLQDLFIPASAMWPRTTAGCATLAKTEMTTSLFNIQSLDFDTTTQEFAQFQIALPRNWNNGTVTVRVYWTAASGSGTVQWGISGGAYSDDDALTVALGSAQTVDDTLIAVNDLHLTDYTAAITLAGTPADADFLAFQISRNTSADTLSVDAKLLGVVITLTTDAAVAP